MYLLLSHAHLVRNAFVVVVVGALFGLWSCSNCAVVVVAVAELLFMLFYGFYGHKDALACPTAASC